MAVEADVYKGVDSPMVMTREYFIEFNCDYDLMMYPFDTQICEMLFQINGIPKQYLKWHVFHIELMLNLLVNLKQKNRPVLNLF